MHYNFVLEKSKVLKQMYYLPICEDTQILISRFGKRKQKVKVFAVIEPVIALFTYLIHNF